MKDYQFPSGFLWGAGTSAHQVEGGNHNDWSQWEQTGHATDHAGQAADHWHKWREDYAWLSRLNFNAYRFSIEWSRVEPRPGEFNAEAIEHYREQLADLNERGITPLVTLHHFTNPTWLVSWDHKGAVKHFVRYVEHVVMALGEYVPYWCTINEPNVLVSLGWLEGKWPPGIRNPWRAWRAIRHLIQAHRQAYQVIHEICQEQGWDKPAVSLAFNLQYFEPRPSPLDQLVTAIVGYLTNSYALRQTRNWLDYIGVNYYFANRLSLVPPRFAGGLDTLDGRELPHTDLDWVVYPKGLYFVLASLKKYNLPIIITENGLADAADQHRERFIIDHLRSVRDALADDVDVRGYLHWSLIDNFEWLDGFDGRFGLVAVNFDTQQRKIRPSAKVYARIARTNALPGDES